MKFHSAVCNARRLQISLQWISLRATAHGRNPSTMETTVKLWFQWRQNFMLSIWGWLFPQQSLNCSTKFVKSLFISLAWSKAGPRWCFCEHPATSAIFLKTELFVFHRVIRLSLWTTDIYPLFSYFCISYPELRFNVKPHTHKLSEEVAVAWIALFPLCMDTELIMPSPWPLPAPRGSRGSTALQVSLHFFQFSLRCAEAAFTAPAAPHAGEHPHPFGSKGPESRWKD